MTASDHPKVIHFEDEYSDAEFGKNISTKTA